MKRSYVLLAISLFACVCGLIGCGVSFGPTVKYSRAVNMSAAMNDGALFEAQTHNGAIRVVGAEVVQCSLAATVEGSAPTEEVARALAEATVVTLEPRGDGLIVMIDKPSLKSNQSISVSLNAEVPRRTGLDLTTHNGGIEVVNIQGDVEGTSHNGKVAATRVTGDVELMTHNGKVVCREFVGDAHLITHNGGVLLSYLESAPPVCDVSAESHNGSIEFVAAPGLSARADIETYNGSINTDIPITIVGELSKNRRRGTIGSGEGRLRLSTHNGSIRIR